MFLLYAITLSLNSIISFNLPYCSITSHKRAGITFFIDVNSGASSVNPGWGFGLGERGKFRGDNFVVFV